jgi:hypothetical protein
MKSVVSLSRMKSVNTFQTSPGFPCWYKRGSHLMSLTKMERFSVCSPPLIAICIISWSIYYLERWGMNGNDLKWFGKWHELILVMIEIEMAENFPYYFLLKYYLIICNVYIVDYLQFELYRFLIFTFVYSLFIVSLVALCRLLTCIETGDELNSVIALSLT